jgi:exonuclease SbcD
MRFLHTADWHLGRLFHQVHLTEDQAFVLRQLIDIARDARVDAIVVAGDVYDRAVPPPEAVKLLDDTLAELLLGLKVPTILAAGNHDSPERLSFGARVLARQGLHLFGLPSADLVPVVLGDAHGPVSFYVAPYAEPALIRERLANPDVGDHESGMRALLASMVGAHPPQGRIVFVGHAFVDGALGSDSERPLSVGGAGTVDASNFGSFHYAALGHLHRPQDIPSSPARTTIRYSGALLKYSFDEVGQHRSVTIVDIDAAGSIRVEEIPLVPRRELRRIEGTLDDLVRPDISLPLPASARQDYIVARLLDRHPVLDPIGRLRAIYPNILCIERALDLASGGAAGPDGQPARDRRQLDYAQLFANFFKDVTGNAPTPDEAAAFAAIADAVAGHDREVRA